MGGFNFTKAPDGSLRLPITTRARWGDPIRIHTCATNPKQFNDSTQLTGRMFQRATTVAVVEAAPAAARSRAAAAAAVGGLRRQCLSTATGMGSSGSVSSVSSSSRLGGEASRCTIRSRAEGMAVGVVAREQRRQLHAAGGVRAYFV